MILCTHPANGIDREEVNELEWRILSSFLSFGFFPFLSRAICSFNPSVSLDLSNRHLNESCGATRQFAQGRTQLSSRRQKLAKIKTSGKEKNSRYNSTYITEKSAANNVTFSFFLLPLFSKLLLMGNGKGDSASAPFGPSTIQPTAESITTTTTTTSVQTYLFFCNNLRKLHALIEGRERRNCLNTLWTALKHLVDERRRQRSLRRGWCRQQAATDKSNNNDVT